MTAERDAARAEVARLTAALNRVATEIENSAGINSAVFADMVRAALRGDTAPAQVMTGAAERTIEWE